MPTLTRDQIRQGLQKRIEALIQGYRQNVGLVGPAGLGKTRLLCELFHSLHSHADILPIYVNAEISDFEQFAEVWIGAILHGAFISRGLESPVDYQSLLNGAESVFPKTAERIKRLKKTLRKEKNTPLLRELFALPAVLSEETGKRILLMIDEFQGLEQLPLTDPFACLGREIMTQKNTLYLVSSSKPERALEIFREKLTLLFANFEVMELHPFSFRETQNFFNQELSHLELSETQQKFVIALTNGEPVYMQLLAERLRGLSRGPVREKVDNEVIFQAVNDEIFESKGRIIYLFENRLLQATRGSRGFRDSWPLVHVLLALSEGRHRVVSVANYIQRRTAETKNLLQKLCHEELVRKRGGFYVLNDPLFEFWLREVYKRRLHCYRPRAEGLAGEVKAALGRFYDKIESEEKMDITSRVEKLFKEFRNDIIEIESRKFLCPQFSEIVFRPTNGRVFPLFARNQNTRWFCQIAPEFVMEEDIAFFLEESRRFRKQMQRRILIALTGIDQNAKLMAQEAKIQLWGLRDFNALLSLYDLPKMIILSSRVCHESTMGAVAGSVPQA